ncbi:MAG: hypothetical protein ABI609_17195 [Acidobacteriota bacterium]
MNHPDYESLSRRLRESDPAEEPSSLEIAAMRRRILDSAGEPTRDIVRWQPLVLTGALLALGVVVLSTPRWFTGSVERPPARAAETHSAQPSHEARQVQFQTPGGTRVIWVVASNLDL